MLRFQLFPRSIGMDETIRNVIDCFEKHIHEIDSPAHNLKSDEVLKAIAPELKNLGFRVEESKASEDKIKVPVLFSLNNQIDKFFDADARCLRFHYAQQFPLLSGFIIVGSNSLQLIAIYHFPMQYVYIVDYQ